MSLVQLLTFLLAVSIVVAAGALLRAVCVGWVVGDWAETTPPTSTTDQRAPPLEDPYHPGPNASLGPAEATTATEETPTTAPPSPADGVQTQAEPPQSPRQPRRLDSPQDSQVLSPGGTPTSQAVDDPEEPQTAPATPPAVQYENPSALPSWGGNPDAERMLVPRDRPSRSPTGAARRQGPHADRVMDDSDPAWGYQPVERTARDDEEQSPQGGNGD